MKSEFNSWDYLKDALGVFFLGKKANYVHKNCVDDAFFREKDLHKTIVNTSSIVSKIDKEIPLDEWNKKDLNGLVCSLKDLHKIIKHDH